MKKIILSIMLITVLTLSLFISPKVNAAESEYNEYYVLMDQIDQYITDGTLPSWHDKYKDNPFYQEYLTHFIGNGILERYGELEENVLVDLLSYFEDCSNEIKNKIIPDNNVITDELTANQSLGFYFDGINLYFLWTSKYLPTTYLTLDSLTINIKGSSKTFSNGYMTDEESTCPHINGDQIVDVTENIYFPEQNLQINATLVSFYHLCSENKKMYTGGLTYNNKFYDLMNLTPITVEGFTITTDEGTYYDINESITDSSTYDLVEKCEFEGDSILVTKLLKLKALDQAALQELEDRYRVVFNFNNDEYLNAAYICAKIKYDGELKECVLVRDANQIGHYKYYDFIEISKERIELLEIKSVKLSVWNSDTVSSLDTYDTIYSVSNPRSLKIEQFHVEATETIWNTTTGEIIIEIPVKVEGFDEKLPNDQVNIETDPDDSNDNKDEDIEIENNDKNDNTDNKDESNQDEEKDKFDQTFNIILTVSLTIILIFIIYKLFSFIRKFIK